MKYNARGSRQDIEAPKTREWKADGSCGMQWPWGFVAGYWGAVFNACHFNGLSHSNPGDGTAQSGILAPSLWKRKRALHLDGADSGEQVQCRREGRWPSRRGLQVHLTFRSSHAQTPRWVCRFFWGGGVRVGMSSLHSVTYRGNVSSKRACVWDLKSCCEVECWLSRLLVWRDLTFTWLQGV